MITEKEQEMMSTRKMITVLTLIMAIGMIGAASAQEVLWDQTAGYESWQQGFFNAIAGGPPFGSTNYTVNDVVVPAGGWNVDAISVYYDGFDFSWDGAISTAVLYIEPKTGSVPVGDPTTGTTVMASASYLPNGFMVVTATGLGTALTEGEYWIGLTPNAPTPDNIHVSVPAVGDDSPTYDPNGFPMPMWTGWAPGLDGAMLIEGDFGAVATEGATWGNLKAIYR
jgi:hypothetical protein